MRKYLIVGINSFLSFQLAQILKKDNQVTGIYNTNTSNLDPDIHNICVTDLMQLKDEKFDCIFLIAAYVPSNKGPAETAKLYEANVALPQQIISLFPKTRIVYASSVSVYGEDGGLEINEDSQSGHIGPYGLSKLWGEEVIRHQSANYAIFRISSMYGPGMKTSTFLPYVIKSAIGEKKITIYGDGKRKQNYIHVADVAHMLQLAGNDSYGGTYLATAAQSYSNLQIAKEVAAQLDGVSINFTGTDSSPDKIYNAGKTYETLGFKPGLDITKGIYELIQWMRETF